MDEFNLWADLVTFGIACVGAVLGIINTWKSLSREKVKLRVKFIRAVANVRDLPSDLAGVEVTNLSAFPVTIIEVGMTIHNSPKRAVLGNPIMTDGGNFPRRLESREQFTAYADPANFSPGTTHRKAFAKTACGVVKKSRIKTSSKGIRQLFVGRPGPYS